MTVPRLIGKLRRSGVILTAVGDRIAFDAPAGAMSAEAKAELASRRAEVLAVLRGDYLGAALALVQRVEDERRRERLVEAFDERVAACVLDGGVSRGEAQRAAYREMAWRASRPDA